MISHVKGKERRPHDAVHLMMMEEENGGKQKWTTTTVER
jgi:hypothetical protein